MRFLVSVLALLSLSACHPPVPPQAADPESENWTTVHLSVSPSAVSPETMANPLGWERKNTAFYHVWVSAFADGPDSDSTGDLVGLKSKIDEGYFTDLGVNALWLSPVFRAASLDPSNANKHGYDTIDYDVVDPVYGTKDDLKAVLYAAHGRGIRVIFDFVPNHTSNLHPWFATKKSWYTTRPTKPSGWTGFDGGSDWYSYPYSGGGYYYGVFWDGMPDLNYRNPAVRDEMASIATRWLNFGFDGMRVDAVKYLVEGTSDAQWFDQPETYSWFQTLRQVLDRYSPLGSAKFMVAENWTSDFDSLKSYLVKDGKPAFSMTFDFDWPWWVAHRLSGEGTAEEKNDLAWALVQRPSDLPSGTTFGTFQTNHDNAADRPATAYAAHDQGPRQFLAAGLSVLGKGTPFLYYGNETGQTGAAGVDLDLRQPLDWNRVALQKTDPSSLWSWHSALLRLRTLSPAWDDPKISSLDSPAGTLAWLVTGRSGARVALLANLTNASLSSSTLSGFSGDLSRAQTVLGAGQPSHGNNSLTLTAIPPYGLRAMALDEDHPVVVRDSDGDGTSFTPPPVVYPPLFLRGTMNDWGSTALIDLGQGQFHQTFLATTDDEVLFKFGTPDWATALGYTEMLYDQGQGGLAPEAVTGVPDGFQGFNIRFLATAGTTYDLHLDTSQQPPRFWVLTTP